MCLSILIHAKQQELWTDFQFRPMQEIYNETGWKICVLEYKIEEDILEHHQQLQMFLPSCRVHNSCFVIIFFLF
jgi:hypothetical protein